MLKSFYKNPKTFNQVLWIFLLCLKNLNYFPQRFVYIYVNVACSSQPLGFIKSQTNVLATQDLQNDSKTKTNFMLNSKTTKTIKRLIIILLILISPSQDFSQVSQRFPYIPNNSTEVVKPLEQTLQEIKNINVKNLRHITNKQQAIDSIKQYFPKVDKWSLAHNTEGLITICRLDVVWTYLLVKYNIPKEISISFFIWETGWAKSYLFLKNYNFGGIRNGKGFKKYKSFLDGVEGFGHTLSLPRYTKDYTLESDHKVMVKAYETNGYWGSEDGYRHRVESIEHFKLYLL